MRQNRAFRRALDCLAHPLSLIAMSILALNALVLQPFWPSWWSGKVGDASNPGVSYISRFESKK